MRFREQFRRLRSRVGDNSVVVSGRARGKLLESGRVMPIRLDSQNPNSATPKLQPAA
jgi:hypothetical protein